MYYVLFPLRLCGSSLFAFHSSVFWDCRLQRLSSSIASIADGSAFVLLLVLGYMSALCLDQTTELTELRVMRRNKKLNTEGSGSFGHILGTRHNSLLTCSAQ